MNLFNYLLSPATKKIKYKSPKKQQRSPKSTISSLYLDVRSFSKSSDKTLHHHSQIFKSLTSPSIPLPPSQVPPRHRQILSDWLINIHTKFRLFPETLYLSFSIIDAYLSKTPYDKNKFQLISISSFLIASKIEDIYFPNLKDLEFVTASSCSKSEILVMEREICQKLKMKFVFKHAYQVFGHLRQILFEPFFQAKTKTPLNFAFFPLQKPTGTTEIPSVPNSFEIPGIIPKNTEQGGFRDTTNIVPGLKEITNLNSESARKTAQTNPRKFELETVFNLGLFFLDHFFMLGKESENSLLTTVCFCYEQAVKVLFGKAEGSRVWAEMKGLILMYLKDCKVTEKWQKEEEETEAERQVLEFAESNLKSGKFKGIMKKYFAEKLKGMENDILRFIEEEREG